MITDTIPLSPPWIRPWTAIDLLTISAVNIRNQIIISNFRHYVRYKLKLKLFLRIPINYSLIKSYKTILMAVELSLFERELKLIKMERDLASYFVINVITDMTVVHTVVNLFTYSFCVHQ